MSATEAKEAQPVDAADLTGANDARPAQASASPDPAAAPETETPAPAGGARKSQGRRNLALALVLAAFVGLVYLITIARIGGASSGAG